MTIRIDRITRLERSDGSYAWRLSIKGFEGKGVYFQAQTGLNGHGLYVMRSTDFGGTDFGGFGASEIFAGGPPVNEILSADRFWAHPGCDARQVVHRVATALVAIGWGPEFYEDRDSISGDWWPY